MEVPGVVVQSKATVEVGMGGVTEMDHCVDGAPQAGRCWGGGRFLSGQIGIGKACR